MKKSGFLKLDASGIVLVFLTAVLLLMVVWIYQSSTAFVAKAQKAKDDDIRLVTVAQQMRVDVIQIQQWLTDISATRALEGLDDGFAEAELSYHSFISGLGVFEQFYAGRDAAMLAQVRGLKGKVDAYYDAGRKMAQAYISEGPASGNRLMARFDEAASALYVELDPFVNGRRAALSGAMEDIVSSADMLKTVTIIIFSVIFLVTFSGLFFQHRNSRRQMDEIKSTMQQAADGDLTVRMREHSGQMASMSLAVNGLIEQFAQVIARVKENADFVYASAEQISEGNDNLSLRLQEQASSLEEAASSMEQMTSTVRHNADSAIEANKLAVSARDEAEKGGTVVRNTVSAMQAINDSSNSIADIISTIESIAFQTNLLALNAAVEAARAGEQGRGFAVVASEVRSLAQRSSEAAKEIKHLIEDSVEKIRIGSEQVDKSGKTLLSIVEGIKKVDELVAEMNNASQEQSAGINEVNLAVAHMDERIQQNAAFVEQSSSSSAHMKNQAAVLNEVLAYFKLDSQVERDSHKQAAPLRLVQPG